MLPAVQRPAEQGLRHYLRLPQQEHVPRRTGILPPIPGKEISTQLNVNSLSWTLFLKKDFSPFQKLNSTCATHKRVTLEDREEGNRCFESFCNSKGYYIFY